MTTTFNWKSNPLSDTYNLFRNEREIGHLKINPFSGNARVIINTNEYHFKTTGIWKQNSRIIDPSDKKLIGTIQYDIWKSEATVSVDQKVLCWKPQSTRNSIWSLLDDERMISYKQHSSTKGQIESNTEDELLVFCGLFIKSHFWQRTVTSLVVVLICCMIVFL
ncbi:MAG: hypothetical protein JXA72_05395 [Bacteroidales bacterium]|nr:hypothetical protein [Bacteroidales bacterium]